MAQRTSGIRAVLSLPWVYRLWGALTGGNKVRAEFIKRYMKVESGDAVFDIGCGPGDVFTVLPPGVEYTGFDISEDYIEEARKQFGDKAQFLHAAVGDMAEVPADHFDLVIALGVLHHLDDGEAEKLFELALGALKPGGRLVTLDGAYDNGQSRLARWIVSKDRGSNIRDKEGYEELARKSFGTVASEIRYDMLRIPYTHIILTCTK